ncbi:MAG: apolipoprotein N-acyltransferase, partial [Burkholderiales bacterium]|nr:apolipoprotein N-acyltransferase [Burkholderiales bacterium]
MSAARWRAAEWAAIALLGALHTLAYVHTSAWPLAVACTAALAWRVGQATPRRAAWLGLSYGSAWLGAGVWWLFISMHRYGGLLAPFAAAAVVLLSVALSGYLALAMGLWSRARRGHVAWDAGLFAIAWLAAELARGLIFTGFPWLASGYALVDAPLAALAPWLGVYGLGALLALAAALLAAPGWIGRAVALGLLLAPALLPPQEFSAPTQTLHAVLLQTNVAQDEKFAIERLPAALAWVGRALRGARGDLVVAPETAVPLLPDQLDQLDPNYWALLIETFRAPGAAQALVGVPLGDFQRGYTNSVVG